jgi:hypothetical protein
MPPIFRYPIILKLKQVVPWCPHSKRKPTMQLYQVIDIQTRQQNIKVVLSGKTLLPIKHVMLYLSHQERMKK